MPILQVFIYISALIPACLFPALWFYNVWFYNHIIVVKLQIKLCTVTSGASIFANNADNGVSGYEEGEKKLYTIIFRSVFYEIIWIGLVLQSLYPACQLQRFIHTAYGAIDYTLGSPCQFIVLSQEHQVSRTKQWHNSQGAKVTTVVKPSRREVQPGHKKCARTRRAALYKSVYIWISKMLAG